MIKILAIIGTRPQYIKHAAFNNACKEVSDIELVTVDTGQHYDNEMSKVFIQDLGIDTIKYNLEVRSSMHGEQTGKMLIGLEKILIDETPNYVIVYGDTNSTLAGSLAAAKLKIPIIHVEAGMRNNNIQVPEEINRTLTDRVSTIKIAPSEVAMRNLEIENLGKNSYHFGDITTDLLLKYKNEGKANEAPFYYITVHRPYNTSDQNRYSSLLNELNKLPHKAIFPIHPRTRNMMIEWGMKESDYSNIEFHKPFDFHRSLQHIMNSECVITDSGGVQKEAYILKKKCISLLPKTPWEETLAGNWNYLVFYDLTEIHKAIKISPSEASYKTNYFGDGEVSKKIIGLLQNEEE